MREGFELIHGSHLEIGLNIWDILSEDDKELINEKSFLLGNVLPDIHPTYRVKKHRTQQFEGRVNKKVEFLCRLNYSHIYNDISVKRFSRELGIICHFLSDFFCMPHSKWGVKESFNLKHMKYEKVLHKHFEKAETLEDVYNIEDNEEYRKFLARCLRNHKIRNTFENDVYYSMYVSNSVIKYILRRIHENSEDL